MLDGVGPIRWGCVNLGPMMNTSRLQSPAFWFVQVPGWLLLGYLVIAQGLTAVSYDFGVSMGTQESAETITEVGAAFWYGFAVGDLLVYIPILLIGLVGHLRNAEWAGVVLAAALGITVYWPIVCLAALVDARDAAGWNLADETPFWLVLTMIAAWGVVGLCVVLKENRNREQHHN